MTLIEILIVIAVLGIIFSIALPQFSKMREHQVLKNAVSDIISSLAIARGETLASINSSSYGVHLDPGKTVVFKGESFSENSPENRVTDIVPPANITNVTFDGVSSSSGYIFFDRLSGKPSKTGTITVSTETFSKIIEISPTGAISVN